MERVGNEGTGIIIISRGRDGCARGRGAFSLCSRVRVCVMRRQIWSVASTHCQIVGLCLGLESRHLRRCGERMGLLSVCVCMLRPLDNNTGRCVDVASCRGWQWVCAVEVGIWSEIIKVASLVLLVMMCVCH